MFVTTVALHLASTGAAAAPESGSGPAGDLAAAAGSIDRAMNENRLLTLPLSGTPSPAKVSHLYHLGAKQFYLDREKPLALSDEQRTRLRRLWEFDQEEKLRYRDSIAGKEREIWRLTGAEVVPLQAVERLVREVERLKADRRVSFLRRVREAAEVLTLHQREMLNRVKGGR